MSAAADMGADGRDPVDVLIEEFLRRVRTGEALDVDAFAAAHEPHAAQLRDLLPMMLQLEDVKRDRASSGSGSARATVPKLDRLGDFRIERELGRGGMGVVFEAVQESLNRRVALKVLPQAALLTGNQLERFRREAQIAARLHHTNIVPVYGSGEADGYHWYAMQFLAGVSLDEWRRQQRERPPEGSGAWRSRARFVARVGAAAAAALHYAHGQGTLHRDIKPANFLLDGDDHVWVTDFGLAKALESEGLTHSGDVLGTLQYMAPEQFAGDYDGRSEVYALGATLYEILTLEPAFRGQNRSELIEKVRGQRQVPIARLCPDVPADLAIIIEKAMAREPSDRYPDAQALQEDLEAFLEDRPIRARRLSLLASTWRWCRRNRALASLAAVAAASAAIAGVTGWVGYVKTSEALGAAEVARQSADRNLDLFMDKFGEVFDALVGRSPNLAFDEDPDTGERTAFVTAPISERDVEVLQKMLQAYDGFAQQNASNEALRYETARAYHRVGAVHMRLGTREDLAAAQRALESARDGFGMLVGRDVRRELAMVHVDLGQLHMRDFGATAGAAAEADFRAALALLEALPQRDTAPVQLVCAKLLFELGRIRSRTFVARGKDIAAGLEALDALLAQSPDDPDVRALHARLLRERSRFGVERPGPEGPGSERPARERPGSERRSTASSSQQYQQALVILRQLVTEFPERAEFRFELCDTLLMGLRRWRGGAGDADERLRRLAEADALAEQLLAEQPLFRESRLLFLRVRSEHGAELLRRAEEVAVDGDATARAQRDAWLQDAADKLQRALDEGEQGERLWTGNVFEDGRLHGYLQAIRGRLGSALLAIGEAERALAIATDGVAELERVSAAFEVARDARRVPPFERGFPGDGPPPPREGDRRPTRGRPGRWAGGERRGRALRDPLRALVTAIGDRELLARLQKLDESRRGPR